MTEIVLTAEQAAIVERTGDPLKLRDPAGKLLGYFAPTISVEGMTEEEIIEECKRRRASNARRIPMEEVLKELKELAAKKG